MTEISVIIPTFNRANLLKDTLNSFLEQTLSREKYEIIVIDDGSSDETRKCVKSFLEKLPIKYFFQNNAGISSAKNHGIFAATGEILFFLDDDDLLKPDLLEQHLATHKKYLDDCFAVLNHTTWGKNLKITPLMEFIVGDGAFLTSYSNLKDGQVLDYTYFWGGRSSCKRKFLIEHGVFNPVFKFGMEDIELGFRLSKFGFKVIYNKQAVSFGNRPYNFDEFIKRIYKQGQSQFVCSCLHKDREIQVYTKADVADKIWKKIGEFYTAKLRAAKELDKIATLRSEMGLKFGDRLRSLLHSSYFWAFRATNIKGLIDKRKSQSMTSGGLEQWTHDAGGMN